MVSHVVKVDHKYSGTSGGGEGLLLLKVFLIILQSKRKVILVQLWINFFVPALLLQNWNISSQDSFTFKMPSLAWKLVIHSSILQCKYCRRHRLQLDFAMTVCWLIQVQAVFKTAPRRTQTAPVYRGSVALRRLGLVKWRQAERIQDDDIWIESIAM